MIIFDLRCGNDHSFEGWFASGDDYARQHDAELVRCPVCDDAQIARLPSAKVRVTRSAAPVAPVPVATSAPMSAPSSDAVAGLPPEIFAKLREIVRSTENVGERFPEEARRIHYEESPARAIRGKASREEAEALTEEGIEFTSLPSVLSSESH